MPFFVYRLYILEKHICHGGQVNVFGKITELVILKSRSLDDTKKLIKVDSYLSAQKFSSYDSSKMIIIIF